MRFKVIQKILGLLLAVFSLTLLPPLFIAHWTRDGAGDAFASAIAVTLIAGLILWLPVRQVTQDMRLRDGFVVVVLFWAVLGISGAIPFMLVESLKMAPADAIFESMSGLTTTGATVIVGLDYLPPSILFYRQLLHHLLLLHHRQRRQHNRTVESVNLVIISGE